jgi:hypothetical protein
MKENYMICNCKKVSYFDIADALHQMLEVVAVAFVRPEVHSLYADEVLVRNGWIKCYTSMFDRNHIRLYCPQRLTDIQKKILRDDYFDHPENWDKCEKYLLEELEVIEPEYDESGCCI